MGRTSQLIDDELTSCANLRCDAKFTPTSSRQKYCSDTCRHNAARDNDITINHQITCRDCGQVFRSKSARAWKCDECKRQTAIQRRIDREENNLTFIGVDGEGVPGECGICQCQGPDSSDNFTHDENELTYCPCGHAVIDHAHKYVLIGVGDQQYENPNGLSWSEVFTFLYQQFEKNPQAGYVGFYLGYDYTQWLGFRSGFPEAKARKLSTKKGIASRKRGSHYNGGGRQPWPVQVRNGDMEWEVDVLAGKRMKIRPRKIVIKNGGRVSEYKAAGESTGTGYRWMYICDAGPYFQEAFHSVINPKQWKDDPDGPPCTEDEYRDILEGKKRRSVAVLDDEMRRYNRLENKILAEVMRRLNAGLVKIDVRLNARQWFGPGQVAQQILKLYGAPKREDLVKCTPPGILDKLIKSYIAGWFESMMHGLLKMILWEYDVNSAYPHTITELPCLGIYTGSGDERVFTPHGRWTETGRFPKPIPMPELERGKYRLIHARVQGSNPYIGAMLHRIWQSTHIMRPQETSGWYWQREVEAAMRAGLIDEVWVDEYIEFTVTCDCPPPLKNFEALYRMRKNVKKSAKGRAYKTGYNSAYGKLAQSIGEPIYSNPFWASLITSGCRTRILDAIATHPKGAAAVAQVATDAVYFTEPHPGLTVSTELGEWELVKHENLVIFGPGKSWDDSVLKDKDAPIKTRGVSAKDMRRHIAEINEQFSSWKPGEPVTWPTVTFPRTFPMVTVLQALMRNQWHMAGQFEMLEDNAVKQSSDPHMKRTGIYYDEEYKVWRSRPYAEPWKLAPLMQATMMGYRDIESQWYDKRFGVAADIDEDRIDSAPGGVTPDGPYLMHVREHMGWG